MTNVPILITGAAQRLGLACAQRFLSEGQPLIITYRTTRPGLEALRALGAVTLFADFSTEQGITEFVETLQKTTDSLRAIVHNASSWFSETTHNSGGAFTEMFRVHMLAPYLINKACRPLLLRSHPADIIHISDDVVARGSVQHMAYAATKAGLDNLTLSFAAQFAPQIKVNTIAPALITFQAVDSPEYRARALKKSVLGIEPGADTLYQSIRYLLDNPYLTGSTLRLNGGRHLVSA